MFNSNPSRPPVTDDHHEDDGHAHGHGHSHKRRRRDTAIKKAVETVKGSNVITKQFTIMIKLSMFYSHVIMYCLHFFCPSH